LQALAAKGKLAKELSVKLTAPLAPAILIAFVVLHIIGDWLWHLFM
jgi:prepilin signal peptidase PulO-like enzyme (type II secretory pathway)